MAHQGTVLVFAPNRAGEQFVQALSESSGAFCIVACCSPEQLYSDRLGPDNLIRVNMKEDTFIKPPASEFSKVYIFEEELERCCEFLAIIRHWACGTIYVITSNHYPQMIYRAMGADYVIRTTSDDCSFLIEKGAN